MWTHLLDHRSCYSALKKGWCTQFILTLIGFHWVGYTAYQFGHLPVVIACLTLIAFCSFASLHFPLAFAAWTLIPKKIDELMPEWCRLLVLALFLMIFEIQFPMIFPWNFGYIWIWGNLPAQHWADTIGVQGLSGVIILFNVLTTLIWRNRRSKRFVFYGISTALGLFLTFNALGSFKKAYWQKTDSNVSMLLVQGNIGDLEKYYAERGPQFRSFILDRYFQLTRDSLLLYPQADIIFWPETAFPTALDSKFYRHPQLNRGAFLLQHRLHTFLAEMDKPLITGGYSRDSQIEDDIYNALFFIQPNQVENPKPYRKTHLLAFGEYFPGIEWFPSIAERIPAISNFQRGRGPQVTSFKNIQWGPQICYEGLYPEFSRQLSLKGAEILINVTNDSWFGVPFEPYQHLYMTLGRAIENRRPLIRVTNTGYSTAILADGTILPKSPLHVEWTGLLEIPYRKNPPLTFYARYGDHLLSIYFVLLLLVFMVPVFNLLKASQKPDPSRGGHK